MVKSRNYTLDLVKLICAFGVISLHIPADTPAANSIGNFFLPYCVAFFYVVSLTYFIKGLANASFDKQLLKIGYRLVIPLLSWTTIYLILLTFKKLLIKERLNLDITDAYFYGKSAVQLYYLPTLILMQLYTLAGYLLINSAKNEKLKGVILLAIGIIYHVVGYQRKCFNTETFIFYPIFILIGLLMYLQLKKQTSRKMLFFASGLILFLSTFFINFNFLPINQVLTFPFMPNLIFPLNRLIFPMGGLGLFLIAISFPAIIETKTTSKIMSTSYGIYLSHVLFLEGLQFFITHAFHQKLLYTFSIKLLIVFVIFVLSLLFTVLTSQIPVLRFLLYGEKRIITKTPALT